MASIYQIKRIEIASEFLPLLMADGECRYRVTEGLPKDAVIQGAAMSGDGRTLELTIRSESFPELSNGDLIPFIYPRFTKIESPS